MSALSNAIYMINKIASHQADGITFTELVRGSDIANGSAHRTLKELTQLNVLTYDETRKTYRIGLLLASIGSQVISHYDIRKNARPALRALHEKLGSVVTLGIRDGLAGIYIDKIEERSFALKLHSEIGKNFPLHCTAMGKILLAHANPKVIRDITRNKLESFTPNTIVDPKALRREITKTGERGFAIDNEEITRGLVCIAAPIFGIDGQVAGTLSHTCEKHIFESSGQKQIIQHVLDAAMAASR